MGKSSMKNRVLAFTAIGTAALICAPAFAQSPPPPAPPATMQPIPNPPEIPKAPTKMKHHARKTAKTEASTPAATPSK
jgi:hypothetical protein